MKTFKKLPEHITSLNNEMLSLKSQFSRLQFQPQQASDSGHINYEEQAPQKKEVKIIELTEDVEGEIFELELVQINKELGSVKEFWFISSRNFKGKVDYESLLDKNFYKIKTIYFKEMVVIKFDNITKDLITIH